jgi:hypothetical protein
MGLPRVGETLEVVCTEYDIQEYDYNTADFITVLLLSNFVL